MDKQIEKNKKDNLFDLSFNDKSNLLQAIVNVEVFGKPKCKTRRRRFYGAKGINR